MPINYPPSSWFETAGQGAYQFADKVRDAVATHLCTIWSNFPDYLTNGKDPASSYTRGFFNAACDLGGFSPVVPNVPFTGGQCEVKYNISLTVAIFPSTTSCSRPPEAISTFSAQVWGPVTNIYLTNPSGVCGGFRTLVVDCHGSSGSIREPNLISFVISDFGYGRFQAIQTLGISRDDGLPDDCGDAPPSYPKVPPPTASDLNTTIIIDDIDNSRISFPVTWNRISNDFNFPVSLDVGGIDVTIDLSGMTFQGDRNVTDPSGTNELPIGDKKVTEPDGTVVSIPRGDQEVVLPDYPVIPPEDLDLEWILCESGIITPIAETIKVLPNIAPIVTLLVDLFVNVIEEMCKLDSDVGLPEIYPVLPGANRPIIMYYYKQVIGGVKQASTFVSTLPNPSSGAIAEIETADYPDRSLGNFVYSIKLLDGSRIVARGSDEATALSHFEFLLGRVSPEFVPPDILAARVLTKHNRMNTLTVKCTQVEYYPDGKDFARNPSIRRIIMLPPE